MNNLIEIQSEIEKLQKRASDIKAKEFDKTVQDILLKMQAFGITLKDLHPRKVRGDRSKTNTTTGSKRAGSKTKKVGVGVVAAKYLGPNGETWSGRGLTPRWLSALVAQGSTKEEFAIKS